MDHFVLKHFKAQVSKRRGKVELSNLGAVTLADVEEGEAGDGCTIYNSIEGARLNKENIRLLL